jgi:hypothetical protein
MIDKFFTFKEHQTHLSMAKILKSEIAYVGGVAPYWKDSDFSSNPRFTMILKNSNVVMTAIYDTEEAAISAHTALLKDLDIINNIDSALFDTVSRLS